MRRRRRFCLRRRRRIRRLRLRRSRLLARLYFLRSKRLRIKRLPILRNFLRNLNRPRRILNASGLRLRLIIRPFLLRFIIRHFLAPGNFTL